MRVLIAVLFLFMAQAAQANTTPEQRTQKATVVLKEMSAIPENSIPERLLAEAYAIAMGQELVYDDGGNLLSGSLLDYFVPTAVETPKWETDYTVTPSPHHPIGAKGVGESPNVGGVSAFSNAVIDAFAHLGVTHMAMPHSAWRVWQTCHALGLDKH